MNRALAIVYVFVAVLAGWLIMTNMSTKVAIKIYAQDHNMPFLCNFGFDKNGCLVWIGTSYDSADTCRMIDVRDHNRKNICLSNVANDLKNISMCNLIDTSMEPYEFNFCITSFAVWQKNVTLCEKIISAEPSISKVSFSEEVASKEDCLQRVNKEIQFARDLKAIQNQT